MAQPHELVPNGLHLKLAFFDFAYMLGEFLQGLDELHVKLQLVERFAAKVQHNLELLSRRENFFERAREFLRAENQELVLALDRYGMFYDKYRLSLVRLSCAGATGELVLEDRYNGSRFVTRLHQILGVLLEHVFDSTPVQEMGLFALEGQVLQLASRVDEKPGLTARKALIALHEAARHVHVYVKKEKIAGVELLAQGQPVAAEARLAEAQETDKERFLRSPLVQEFLARFEVPAS